MMSMQLSMHSARRRRWPWRVRLALAAITPVHPWTSRAPGGGGGRGRSERHQAGKLCHGVVAIPARAGGGSRPVANEFGTRVRTVEPAPPQMEGSPEI